MSYKTILKGGQGEIEEKKSRFIASIFPAASEEEALKLIASVKKQYWDARHNCYAYTIGETNELMRCSDDGEPGGTAGRPMLDILVREEVHNCVAVVTRYFGGTLLGTGGLVRAYQKAVSEGLLHCVIIEKTAGRKLTIRTDYNSIGKLQYLIARDSIPTLDTRYTDAVEVDVILPVDTYPAFCDTVTEATSAKAKLIPGEITEFAVADGEILLFED